MATITGHSLPDFDTWLADRDAALTFTATYGMADPTDESLTFQTIVIRDAFSPSDACAQATEMAHMHARAFGLSVLSVERVSA